MLGEADQGEGWEEQGVRVRDDVDGGGGGRGRGEAELACECVYRCLRLQFAVCTVL